MATVSETKRTAFAVLNFAFCTKPSPLGDGGFVADKLARGKFT